MARYRLQVSLLLLFFTLLAQVLGHRAPPSNFQQAGNHDHSHGHGQEHTPADDKAFASHVAKSILKRDASIHCRDSTMAPFILEAMIDIQSIMTNTVKALRLLETLFDPSGSGELRAGKEHENNRLLDEQIVFGTYSQFVHRANWGPRHEKNRDSWQAIQYTIGVAINMQRSIAAFLANQPVANRGRLRIHCDELEFLGDSNWQGLTYTEATGNRNPDSNKNYWLWQDKGTRRTATEYGMWVSFDQLCPHQWGQQNRQLGTLTIPCMNAYAYVLTPSANQTDESLTFCSWVFPHWIHHEATTKQNGVHYRDLHVENFYRPSDAQKAAARTLVNGGTTFMHIQDFFVTTLIHELSHAPAMTTAYYALDDIKCDDGRSSTNLPCLARIARCDDGINKNGRPQGEFDAEAFTTFSMAMWVNSVTWYQDFTAHFRPDQ